MHTYKMKRPTTTVTAIATAQFDEDGDGLWLMDTEVISDLTKAKADRLFLDRVEQAVKYFTDNEVKFAKRTAYKDDDIEVKFDNDTAKIYYNDITQHIRITFSELKD